MRTLIAQFTLFSLLLASGTAHADLQYNLTSGVTPISHDIYNLHMSVIWLCVVIGLIVFGTLAHILIYHRKSLGVTPAKFHENTRLELFWTIIPILILISLAVPGTRVLSHLRDESKPDLTIKITGFQWKWKYDYIENGINFFSNLSTPIEQRLGKAPKGINYLREVDHPLVVPIHKKIRFLVTSNDVIHSWWVPELGVKQDAVPGFINENWARINRPGTYRGQCAELCGINHAFMPIVVIAMTENDYNNWVKSITTPATTVPTAVQTAPAAPSPTSKPTAAPEKTQTPPPQQVSQQKPNVSATTQTTSQASVTSAKPTTAPTQTPTNTQVPGATPHTSNLNELIEHGKSIFLNTCSACHQPDGSGLPPTYPNLITSPVTNGPVDKHIHTVVFGVPGTAMQAFGQQFSPEDIAAVITYERNEIAHRKGDIVQPADIVAAEKSGG